MYVRIREEVFRGGNESHARPSLKRSLSSKCGRVGAGVYFASNLHQRMGWPLADGGPCLTCWSCGLIDHGPHTHYILYEQHTFHTFCTVCAFGSDSIPPAESLYNYVLVFCMEYTHCLCGVHKLVLLFIMTMYSTWKVPLTSSLSN